MYLKLDQDILEQLVSLKQSLSKQRGIGISWPIFFSELILAYSDYENLSKQVVELQKQILEKTEHYLELSLTRNSTITMQNANLPLPFAPPTPPNAPPKLPPKPILIANTGNTKADFLNEMHSICTLGDGESLKPSAVKQNTESITKIIKFS